MSDLLFMKLSGDNFEGEEPIGTKGKLVRIKSFSHSVSQELAPLRPSALSGAKELRRGAPNQGLFTVTRYFDKVSPKLFSAACAGIRFDHVWIYFSSVMPDANNKEHEIEPILKIQLENVVIAEFNYGYTQTWPSEEMSFAYTSIGWRTNWPDPKSGKMGMLADEGWDGEKNIPVARGFKDKNWDLSEA